MKKFIIAILMTSWLLSLGMICAMSEEQQEKLNQELHSAAFNGNLDKVKGYITQGAQVDAQDPKNGLIALMEALINDGIAVIDEIAVIKYLIENDAKVDKRNDKEETALMIAARTGKLAAVKFLIEKEADVNAKDIYGYTALMHAVIKNRLPIIKYLIETGADVDKQNYKKETALSIAKNRTIQNQPIIDYLQLVTDYQTAEANNKLPKFLQTLYDDKRFDELDDLFAIALNMVPEKNPAAFYDEKFSNHNHYKNPLIQLQIAEKHDFYAPTKTILSKGTKVSDLELKKLMEQAQKDGSNLFEKALAEYKREQKPQKNAIIKLKRKDFHDLKFKFN